MGCSESKAESTSTRRKFSGGTKKDVAEKYEGSALSARSNKSPAGSPAAGETLPASLKSKNHGWVMAGESDGDSNDGDSNDATTGWGTTPVNSLTPLNANGGSNKRGSHIVNGTATSPQHIHRADDDDDDDVDNAVLVFDADDVEDDDDQEDDLLTHITAKPPLGRHSSKLAAMIHSGKADGHDTDVGGGRNDDDASSSAATPSGSAGGFDDDDLVEEIL